MEGKSEGRPRLCGLRPVERIVHFCTLYTLYNILCTPFFDNRCTENVSLKHPYSLTSGFKV